MFIEKGSPFLQKKLANYIHRKEVFPMNIYYRFNRSNSKKDWGENHLVNYLSLENFETIHNI